MSRLVPCVFMLMASVKFPSNRSVAAQWNTMFTSLQRRVRCSPLSPRAVRERERKRRYFNWRFHRKFLWLAANSPANVTSPWIGTNFLSTSGFSSRMRLNACGRERYEWRRFYCIFGHLETQYKNKLNRNNGRMRITSIKCISSGQFIDQQNLSDSGQQQLRRRRLGHSTPIICVITFNSRV